MELKKLAFFFGEEVQTCRQRLCEHLYEKGIACSNSLMEKAICHLNFTLFNQSQKTLITHFQSVKEHISFDEFTESFQKEPEVKHFFFKLYPVLKQRIAILCQHWLEQTVNIIERYHIDRESIASDILNVTVAPDIVDIRYAMGDAHRGGKSVAILKLSDGQSVVYKPRSLSIDKHFAQLIQQVNTFANTDLILPVCIDQKDYGWVEYVAYKSCENQEQITKFYERLGAYTCILYMLNGTDFHYENLIACGDHPVLIDLESFFHPEIPNISEVKEDSVLMTGILPTEVHLNESVMPDISGMTDVEGTEGIFNAMVLVPDGSGEYEFIRRKGKLDGAQNIPKLNGVKVSLDIDQVTVFKSGFKHLYEKVLENQCAFKRYVSEFKNDNIRVLLRFTACYSYLLTESDHPAVMTSQEVEFEHFNGLSISLQDNTIFKKTIKDEIADLRKMDVPLFTTKANSKDLWLGDSRKIKAFFEHSGFDTVQRKLERLSKNDLSYQLWIIDTALKLNENLLREKPSYVNDCGQKRDADFESRLIRQAQKVADYIEAHLHEDEKVASWMVVRSSSLDNSTLSFAPAGLDLYAGMPCEILFLTCFGKHMNSPRHSEIAMKAYRLFVSKLESSLQKLNTIGLYYGWGAIIHTFTMLNRITGKRHFLDKIELIIEDVNFDALISEDKRLGLIKGAAGLMLACANNYLYSGSKKTLRLAEQCAEHLLTERQQDYQGYCWRISSAVPLTGMAHGASGFAMAFAKLFQVTNNQKYRHAAQRCIDYERSLFLPDQQNWQDCRDFVIEQCEGKPFSSVAWSHGAPGIGLSRLALLQAGVSDDECVHEHATAVNTTLKKGFEGNDTLIFGAFGNLELLIGSYHYFGEDYLNVLENRTEAVLQKIEQFGWDLGDKNVDSFGLMIGVTGIGYQCLRVLFNEKVPSLLACVK
ncbi:type 2 lanthipeptide synthetase LanM family protein [Alteromonas sp. BMJM2]|uniref:type 2 lanthipeptide synthetase LanM family protein n=1 Tax=Alteromonas sp. BMJM2 TaxID=2954241 RepID=UPI0022B55947|nr:type 2 lanthipeptide synthetase LanM family protein [Alteromonas sp. BMJM2]